MAGKQVNLISRHKTNYVWKVAVIEAFIYHACYAGVYFSLVEES